MPDRPPPPATLHRADTPDVIAETFDGEVTLIHLRHGYYYGLNPTASAIWTTVAPGATDADVIAAVIEAHTEPPADADAQTSAFLRSLREEGLLVPTLEAGPVIPLTMIPGPFDAPTFQRFTDMQELLLLDPVHDIELDADGWPVSRSETAA